MPSRVRIALAAILAIALALLLFDAGAVSPTWDESTDLSIVECLHHTGDPFLCVDDISQARFPFYLHALVASIWSSGDAHYLLSALFATINVALVFLFARSRFDDGVALAAAGLTATAPTVLASGRMLLSHSNVILTTFCLVAVITYEHFDRSAERRWFWASSVAAGLALGSSVLGLLLVPVLAGFWLFGSRPRRVWEPAGFGACALGVFFVSTVIYLRPSNLSAFVASTVGASEVYPYWNYLDLGVNLAPRWYSFLLFAVRLAPWWAALFLIAPLVLLKSGADRAARRFVLVVWGGVLLSLIVKSGLFRYDAPHHQVQWYPLVFVVVAATAVEGVRRAGRWRPFVAAALAVMAFVHAYDGVRFFPNYLFYGAQYGDRFVGEFYGPAVQHSQDRDEIDRAIDELVARDPDVRILMADHNSFEPKSTNFVSFSQRDPMTAYRYAVVDRLFAEHFHLPGRDDYNAHLRSHYRILRSHDFPTGKWAYRILELEQGTDPSGR